MGFFSASTPWLLASPALLWTLHSSSDRQLV